MSFSPGRNEYFLLHFTPGENIFANICIFYERFSYAVIQYGLYQNYVRFHQQ